MSKLAKQHNLFMEVITPDKVFSQWTGVAETNIKAIFARASENRPALIFIDELDSFMKERTTPGESESSLRVKNLILQLCGSELYQLPGLFVICGTNHPEIIDDGFADRIDRTLLLKLPNAKNKFKFFQQYLNEKGMTTTVTEKQFHSVECDRFSYRDLGSWFQSALEEGPWLRNEDSDHFKYVKVHNRSDYIIGCNCSDENCFKIPKEKSNKFPMEMFKFTDLTFEDLLNARGTRAPTATLDRIEEFEDFLINRKKKEKADEITKEVPPIVSHYSFGSLCVNLFVILFLIIVSIVAFSVFRD